MIRGTWVWDRKLEKLVPKHEYQSRQPPVARSDIPMPMIATGQIPETWNPVDGKHYTNMRAYERAVRESKSHIIEPGEVRKNMAKQYIPDLNQTKQDVKEAMDQIEAGTAQPMPIIPED